MVPRHQVTCDVEGNQSTVTFIFNTAFTCHQITVYGFVSDIAVFVLKRDVKLQLTHSLCMAELCMSLAILHHTPYHNRFTAHFPGPPG